MSAKDVINWEAKEYSSKSRTKIWYVGLGLVGILLIGLSIWLNWWSFTGLILVSLAAMVIYVVRPPRELHYSLSNKGISEGNRLYGLEEFRAFGLLKDEDNYSIVLMPRKRFAAKTVIFFPQEKGEKIVDFLGARMPMEEVRQDLLDKIVRILKI